MADILVVHPMLMAKGGGESVCMNVLEALQRDHEVGLLTMQSPDFDELNEYFATSVTDLELWTPTPLETISRTLPVNHLNRFRWSLLNRFIISSNITRGYDLLFSTYNGFTAPSRSIQYIHHPKPHHESSPEMEQNYPLSLYEVYSHFCELVSPSVEGGTSSATYLANSDWTAERVETVFETRPRTVYPPVETAEFQPLEWNDREEGVVSIGRLTPEKNILRNIDIVARLNERGHELSYHIVGPAADKLLSLSENYADKVAARAEEYPFVHLEGEVSRQRLIEIVQSRKYGLHGMDNEHFGIAVAELVAGGTIPFVPRGGGQVEVVDHCEEVLYDSVDDAVEKMDRVLSDESLQRDVRKRLPDVEERFGRDRFQREIREITNRVLG